MGIVHQDVILLILILVLIAGRKYLTPMMAQGKAAVALGVSLLACCLYAYHVMNHLPVIDFRPYAIGKNIEEGMGVPEGAPKAIFEYAWTFDVDGEETVIITNGDYPTVAGEFIGVETEELQAGYEPPVHDFTIEQEGVDYAMELLAEPKLMMVVAYDLRKSDREAFENIRNMAVEASNAGYTVIGMSASGPEQTAAS